MSTRTAKQLVYGAMYVVIFVIVIGLGYLVFAHPFTAPSVAACAPNECAPTSTMTMAGSIASTFITSPGQYTFLGQLTDGSLNFGASAVYYEVDLYDASDTLLQSFPGVSFIYPNQNKYVLIPNVTVSQPFDHAALNVTSVSWIASSTLGVNPAVTQGQFSIQNVIGSLSSSTISVGGELANTSVTTYAQVMVMVLFKDINGTIVGASQTELNTVGAGETTGFSVIYPDEITVNPSLNQVIVYAIR